MRKINCPYCGKKTVIPIVYGYPGAELTDKQKKRELKLGGCEIKPDNPAKHCLSCHKDFDQLHPCAFYVKNFNFLITGYYSTDLRFDIQASVNGYRLIYIKSVNGDEGNGEPKEFLFDLMKWGEIWTKILKCFVFDWNDEYVNNNVIDGPSWELVIELLSESGDGTTQIKRIIGTNHHPVYFNNLLKIFSTIVGEKFS